METPLENMKILDFTRVSAGPFATMILGDLGADVIKVEPPPVMSAEHGPQYWKRVRPATS